MRPGPRLEQWLIDAGFTNVQCPKFILPLGTWPKDKHYVSVNDLWYYNIPSAALPAIPIAPMLSLGESNSSIWILQKQIGAYNFLQMQQGLEGIALATLTRSGEWTLEEVQVLVAKARQDLRNPRIHGQYDL